MNYRRLLAFGPVLLLHAALLIAFLHMDWNPFNELVRPASEITLLLPPIPAVPVWQGDLLPRTGSGASTLPRLVVPAIRNDEPAAAPGNLVAIYQQEIAAAVQQAAPALFRCWPEGPADHAQMQAAQCLTFAPDHSFDYLESTEHAQSATEWFRARERRNAPLLLPCWSGISLATVSCVANGLTNGFDFNNQPSYADYDHEWHMNGIDTIRHEMETVDPCGLDMTVGPGFVCLYRVMNGNAPP